MSWREVRGALGKWAKRGDTAAVATLIEVRRSAPRSPGARFAVSSTGELAGSVSSGCVEGDLHEHLSALLTGAPSALLSYGITDEMAAGVGLSCGGEIDVLIEPHPAWDPVWDALDAAIDRNTPAVLVTGLADPIRGKRLLITATGAGHAEGVALVIGSLGPGPIDELARHTALEIIGRTGTHRLNLDEDDPDTQVFAETFAPPPRLAIVGATPIAEALCAFAARVGFDVTIVDPREAFARPERFPDAAQLIVEWPDTAFERLGLDRFASVVVLTHDAKLDEPALEAALGAGCGYVGLLGGRRTQLKRREALVAAGFDGEDLDRIKGPIGLDIGARSPSQIAVSVIAELIAEDRAP
ncbi:MAG: XdhC family protein [Gemmatimonadota bacterium]|nr:XdhC family protein [Gemmatimonadota bacterium]